MVKRKTEKRKKMKMKKIQVIKKKIKTTKKNVDVKKRTQNKTQYNRKKNRKGNSYPFIISVMDLKNEGYNIFDINVVGENQYSLETEPVAFFMYNNTAREDHLLKTHAVTGDEGKFKEFENQTLCEYLYIDLPYTRIHSENYVFVKEIGPDGKITQRLEDIIRIFRIVERYIQNSKEFELNTNPDMYRLLQQFRADFDIKKPS